MISLGSTHPTNSANLEEGLKEGLTGLERREGLKATLSMKVTMAMAMITVANTLLYVLLSINLSINLSIKLINSN